MKPTSGKTLYKTPPVPTYTQNVLPNPQWMVVVVVVVLVFHAGIVVVQNGVRLVLVTSPQSRFVVPAPPADGRRRQGCIEPREIGHRTVLVSFHHTERHVGSVEGPERQHAGSTRTCTFDGRRCHG